MGNFIVKNARKEKSTTVRDKQNPTKMRAAADSRKPPRSGLVQCCALGYTNAVDSILVWHGEQSVILLNFTISYRWFLFAEDV